MKAHAFIAYKFHENPVRNITGSNLSIEDEEIIHQWATAAAVNLLFSTHSKQNDSMKYF